MLDARAPIITVEIAGQPVRLRVDPGSSRFVELNDSAAKRLDLANPARLVGDRARAISVRTRTEVGKVTVEQQTSDELIGYAGRCAAARRRLGHRRHHRRMPMAPSCRPCCRRTKCAWCAVRPSAGDVTANLPLRWIGARGLLAGIPAGGAAGRCHLLADRAGKHRHRQRGGLAGRFQRRPAGGPERQALIMTGVTRPVRMLVFDRPVAVGPLTHAEVAARIFDWSGRNADPRESRPDDELVVPGKVTAQTRAGPSSPSAATISMPVRRSSGAAFRSKSA